MPRNDSERARRRALRERTKLAVTEINARTVCAHCGAQPIEWHNPDHVELNRPLFRIGNMVGRNSIETIRAEMARCTPLCRRCHMREDGRLRRFVEAGEPGRHGRQRSTAPCIECSRQYYPMRLGLCTGCYTRRRKRATA